MSESSPVNYASRFKRDHQYSSFKEIRSTDPGLRLFTARLIGVFLPQSRIFHSSMMQYDAGRKAGKPQSVPTTVRKRQTHQCTTQTKKISITDLRGFFSLKATHEPYRAGFQLIVLLSKRFARKQLACIIHSCKPLTTYYSPESETWKVYWISCICRFTCKT